MNVLVTGGNGFVGGALIDVLTHREFSVTSVVRKSRPDGRRNVRTVVAAAGLENGLPPESLTGVDAVVHLAARVHVMREKSSDPLAEFRRVNVEGTRNLARLAADAGVKRFVFVSSIKVNGERTVPGRAFRADDAPAPVDPYGRSKHEAEEVVKAIAVQAGMEFTIIRPVLVYGPGAKGNFASMVSWVARGIPLPFGAVPNRRSLVALGNLVDLLSCCVTHPGAANQTFLASDGEDVSTPELLRYVAAALHVPSRLFNVPPELLLAAATLVGKRGVGQRLIGSLQVDITKTRELLGWTPPMSVEQAIREATRIPGA